MTLAAIAGLCISAAVICRIFDKTNREYGVFISAAAAVIITAAVVGLLSPLVDFIDSMFEKAVRQQQTVSLYAPETKSAKAFEILANNLITGAHDIPLMKRGFAQLFAEFLNNR